MQRRVYFLKTFYRFKQWWEYNATLIIGLVLIIAWWAL